MYNPFEKAVFNKRLIIKIIIQTKLQKYMIEQLTIPLSENFVFPIQYSNAISASPTTLTWREVFNNLDTTSFQHLPLKDQ